MPDFSHLARRQAELWADANRGRLDVARRMYAWRLGEVLPHRDIAVLRGIEGARVKALYANLAERFGIQWKGRRYDRADPLAADFPNQALNHAASAVEGAAAIAVTATATIPQRGFVHEDSGQSFVLDIADLFRDKLTVPCAFRAVGVQKKTPHLSIERVTRRLVGDRPPPFRGQARRRRDRVGDWPAERAGVVRSMTVGATLRDGTPAPCCFGLRNSPFPEWPPREPGCRSADATSRLALCASAHAAAALTQPRQTGRG
ncbi:hypothetical protein FHS55_002215 [Angulomicrobium tetraedrale]|uniref:CRISPR-associated endonuclease Cas1 n=1 Tax=Ancylobacter tetraedralis TaxID=217068 RepID=A0A839ZA65_9HYPH|nr:CRISPR-associated endonuclease Cas1 [Ancylobacter tetraedralis]MBB3771616.1 hypothetical protein [Ancylobacter tetraedralis]